MRERPSALAYDVFAVVLLFLMAGCALAVWKWQWAAVFLAPLGYLLGETAVLRHRK